tara:strand:+ start:3863 stop:7987 length:4125 start_codon:yes stop_codon:yes gene_type:complete
MAIVDPNLIDRPDPSGLANDKEEKYQGVKSFLAGIGSGALKIPEGFFSLGATLYDLGAGTDTATEVELFFDNINPFDELAEETMVGKLTETLVSLGVPSTAGFKLGTQLAKQGLKAKRANRYANLTSKGQVKKFKDLDFAQKKKAFRGAEKEILGKSEKLKRSLADRAYLFGGGLGGSALADFVFADEEIGTIGDAIGFGPTQRDEQEREGRSEALREIENRLKFASEGALLTAGIGGAFSFLKKGADSVKYKFTRDPIADSSKRLLSKLTAQGVKPKEAEELLRQFQRESEKFGFQGKAVGANLQQVFEDILDETGNIAQQLKPEQKNKLSAAILQSLKSEQKNELKTVLNELGVNATKQDEIFTTVNNARDFVDNLSNQIRDLVPEGAIALRDTIEKNLGEYLTTTYKLIEKNNKFGSAFAKYKPSSESLENAFQFIKRQILDTEGQGVKVVDADVQAREILENILDGNIKNLETPLNKGVLQRLGLDVDTGILKAKQKIPPEIKAILGEVKDPSYVLSSTIAKQGALITELSMLTNLAKLGKGKIFFFDDAIKKGDKLEKISGRELAQETFGTSDVVNLGQVGGLGKLGLPTALDGAFTSREMAEAFAEQTDAAKGVLNSNLYKYFILAPKSFSQSAKTLFSPFTHFRNILSAAAFVTMNGNISLTNPKKTIEAFTKSLEAFRRGQRGFGKNRRFDPEALKEYLDYGRRGVRGTNLQVGELADLGKDVSSLNLGQKIEDLTGGTLDMLGQRLKRVKDWTVNTYLAEDDFWKIYNYRFEQGNFKDGFVKNFLRSQNIEDGKLSEIIKKVRTAENLEAGPTKDAMLKELRESGDLDIFNRLNDIVGKIIDRKTNINDPIYFVGKDIDPSNAKQSIEEDSLGALIKNLAADSTRNNIPNYEYVGQGIKTLRKLPIGTFVSFPAEILRTGFNTLQSSMRLLSMQETRAQGMRRMAGVLGTGAALPVGAIELGKQLSGFLPEDMEALRRFVPSWSQNGLLVPTGTDERTGRIQYLDLSYIYPYDALLRPGKTMFNELQKGESTNEQMTKRLLDGGVMAMKELVKPFLSEAIYTEAMTDLLIRQGRSRDGRAIFRPEDPVGEKLYKGTMHIVETFAPGSLKQAGRIKDSVMSKPDKYGRVYDLSDELPGIFGFRNIELDVEDSFKFMVSDFNKRIASARATFLGDVLRGGQMTPEQVLEQYYGGEAQRFKAFQDFRKDIQAAERLGINKKELNKQLDRVSKKTKNALLTNRYLPYQPSDEVQRLFYQNALDLVRETGQPLSNPFQKAFSPIKQYLQANTGKSLSDNPNFEFTLPEITSFLDFPIFDSSAPVTPQSPTTNTGPGTIVTGQGSTNANVDARFRQGTITDPTNRAIAGLD